MTKLESAEEMLDAITDDTPGWPRAMSKDEAQALKDELSRLRGAERTVWAPGTSEDGAVASAIEGVWSSTYEDCPAGDGDDVYAVRLSARKVDPLPEDR